MINNLKENPNNYIAMILYDKRYYSYLNNIEANSLRALRHVSHSWAVPCDSW
jgi:hypothetical protein